MCVIATSRVGSVGVKCEFGEFVGHALVLGVAGGGVRFVQAEEGEVARVEHVGHWVA